MAPLDLASSAFLGGRADLAGSGFDRFGRSARPTLIVVGAIAARATRASGAGRRTTAGRRSCASTTDASSDRVRGPRKNRSRTRPRPRTSLRPRTRTKKTRTTAPTRKSAAPATQIVATAWAASEQPKKVEPVIPNLTLRGTKEREAAG